MKVLLVNGSPKENGSTATALAEIIRVFENDGVETELFHVGHEPVRGCQGCMKCLKLDNKCVFGDDLVNEFIEKSKIANGFIFGSPVYYASANGALLSFLDRVFYAGGSLFAGKPAAAVTCARRAGTTAALDDVEKYFSINGMPTVPSQYWPMVFGRKPGDANEDLEGLQTMRVLARNMIWLMKCVQAGKAAGIEYPQAEQPRAWTHFIR
jgi:multimeric flavodoxin WrbA